MKKIIVIIFYIPFLLFSQNEIKIDTSFTSNSAYKKVIKDFPFIKIVKPILPNDINVLRNITYVKYGERELGLDIFFSSTEIGLRPGIVLIHGGGWRTGNKSHQYPMALQLASKGYVAVTVEYRLTNEAIFPAGVIDIKNSIKWLKKNALQFKIDTNKIAVLGCSAGGQLASLVGFSVNENDFEDYENYPGYSSKVRAIVNIDGLLDFLGKESEEFDENPDPQNPRSAHRWLGASHLDDPELWKKASGINYVTQESCPIAFINSSIPRFGAGKDATIEKLKEYNIYYEVHIIKNTPHPFWLFHPWFNETVKHVSEFLEKTL